MEAGSQAREDIKGMSNCKERVRSSSWDLGGLEEALGELAGVGWEDRKGWAGNGLRAAEIKEQFVGNDQV